MKKASNTDSYLHILKYISLFGGVQVLNVLIGIVRNKFVELWNIYECCAQYIRGLRPEQ